MTIRAYIPPAVPLEKLSLENKQKRIVFEKKNVNSIIINEPLKTITISTSGKKEMIGHNDYCIEILSGEPNDRLTEGFTLSY